MMTVTINDDYPMNVFITPNSRLGEWWVEEKHDKFVLHAPEAPDGAGFTYRIVAKRKGYEDIRLLDAPAAWTDRNLYPDIEDVPVEYRSEWIQMETPDRWKPEWRQYMTSEQIQEYERHLEEEKEHSIK